MFIYKITNKINNKIYIGMTTGSIETRWKKHCSLSGSRTTLLKKSIEKYGKDNFAIEQIDFAKDLEELKKKEIFWIKELNSLNPMGYNLQPGGIGGRNESAVLAHEIPIICTTTGERFKSMTDAALRFNLQISKIGAVCKGKRDTTGKLHFEYIDSKKKLDAESIRSKRKDRSAELLRRSQSGRLGASKRFKKIKCIETGEIFESIAAAAKSMCLWRPNITKNLQGKHKSVQGYHFVFA